MIMNEVFIDSNIVLYLMDSDIRKRAVAQEILLLKPFINAQVLTEVANVCKRKFGYDKENILNLWNDLITDCHFIETNKATFYNSIELVKKYNFQIFDSLIVASAVEAHCAILYSEDMHHKLVVESKLTIINPFL
jgi:predicted nucleic acid-binding protein